jgi:hypothetical protein
VNTLYVAVDRFVADRGGITDSIYFLYAVYYIDAINAVRFGSSVLNARHGKIGIQLIRFYQNRSIGFFAVIYQ